MPDVFHEDLGNLVSRETQERILLFESLVKKWNPVINLVSSRSLSDIRGRHIIDSVQLYKRAHGASGLWCDLGSGGGFPGLIVAILASEDDERFRVNLVESDQRKAAFLSEAARQLDLNIQIVASRIERLSPLSANVLSARALAALPKLCEFASVHLAPSGVALFPKGARFQHEIDDARQSWAFNVKVHQSQTDPSGVILELRDIHHA